jgi:hypothetical protein
MTMLTLTVAQILDLANFAGLPISSPSPLDDGEGDVEIVIADCPPEGLRDDEGNPTHYDWIAYFAEYPDEGATGLGAELPPNNQIQRAP